MERSPHRNRFYGRTCNPMGDAHWSRLFLKDCTSWIGPMLEQFIRNCSLWEGPTLEKFKKKGIPWKGPYPGAGEECEESSPQGGRNGQEEEL